MDSRSKTIGVTSGRMSHDGRHASPPDLDDQEVNHTLSGSSVRHHWSMPSNNWHRLISKPLEICAGRNFKTVPLEQPPRCTIASFNLLTLTFLVVFFRLQAVSWANDHLSSQTSSSASPPPKINTELRPSNIAAPPRCESLPTQHAQLPSSSVHDYQQPRVRVRQAGDLCFNTQMSQCKTAPKNATLSPFVGCAVGAALIGARPVFSGFPVSPHHCSRQPATSISLTRDLVIGNCLNLSANC